MKLEEPGDHKQLQVKAVWVMRQGCDTRSVSYRQISEGTTSGEVIVSIQLALTRGERILPQHNYLPLR
jgi:hypothetical protein